MPKAKAAKAKTNETIFTLKIFTTKETINKMKRQHTELEKISDNHISNESLISKIYEEFQ